MYLVEANDEYDDEDEEYEEDDEGGHQIIDGDIDDEEFL